MLGAVAGCACGGDRVPVPGAVSWLRAWWKQAPVPGVVLRVIWRVAPVRWHASGGHGPLGSAPRHTEGMSCEVVGWSWPQERSTAQGPATDIWNQLPNFIFVRFHTKMAWQVHGLETDNLYPVTPQRHAWHIDKGRLGPFL